MNLFLQVRQNLNDNYNYLPKDLLELSKTEAANIIYNCTFNQNGFSDKPTKFKNRSKQRFTDSGQYWADYLLKEQSRNGGTFYTVIVELGKKALYSKKTVLQAKKVADKLFNDFPCYCSIERDKYSLGEIHLHILALLPTNHIVPHSEHNFPVLNYKLGSKPKYAHQTMTENVNKFLGYLMKCSDDRSKEKGSKLYKEMILEWFLDEQAKTIGKGSDNVRLSWAMNLPFVTELKRKAKFAAELRQIIQQTRPDTIMVHNYRIPPNLNPIPHTLFQPFYPHSENHSQTLSNSPNLRL
jgi:hypothetical protein